jgi:hypothetical protein
MDFFTTIISISRLVPAQARSLISWVYVNYERVSQQSHCLLLVHPLTQCHSAHRTRTYCYETKTFNTLPNITTCLSNNILVK